MVLLDQCVFQQQSLFFGVGQHDLDIGDPGHQKFDMIAGIAGLAEIGAYPLAQVAGLADVDDLPAGVAHQVHPGRSRQLPYFILKTHGLHSNRL